MIDSISFCLFNHTRDDVTMRRAIASVMKQGVPSQEIVVCGDLPDADNNIKIIPSKGRIETDNLNQLRNLLCANARNDFIALMVNNIELADGWYEAIKEADCFDIIGSRIVTNAGKRAVDWAYRIKQGSMSFPYPLDYDEWTTKAYVSGNFMLLRRRLWERIKFDEALLRGACDDMDFCLRATSAGFRIGVVPQAEAKYNLESSETIPDITFDKSQTLVCDFKKAFVAGKNAFETRDYTTALAQLTNAVEIVPDDPVTLGLTGWTYYSTGRYEKALEVFDKAIVVDPANHYALRGRGWTYLQSGAYPSAIDDLARALNLTSPDHRDDWLETIRGLAWSHYHNGAFREAKTSFDLILQKSQSHETGLLQDAYRGSGWCCYRMGMLNDAACHFEKALSKIDPANQELLQEARHGLELITLGQRETAENQGPTLYPSIPVLEAHLSSPPSRALMEWRRGLVSRLKATVKRVLSK